MKKVDMKLPKEKKEKFNGVSIADGPKDQYPYGLKISLDVDQIKKLGIEGLNVGDDVTLDANCTVTSKSEKNVQGGKKEMRMEIQIKELIIENCSDNEYMKDDLPASRRIEIAKKRRA